MPSASPYQRGIDDVVDHVRRHQAKEGVVVLLGAGCSKTAGIPLAYEFCSIIADEFRLDYERAKRSGRIGYQDLMAEIGEGERRDLLTRFIDQAKLNWGHIALAELVKHGYVTRILTPNFDPLAVQACALVNVFPAIYDLAASHELRAELVPTPAVFYLHGQRSGFRLLNTERECEEHARRLEPVFEEAGKLRPWLVIGYSGENDPVFERLLAKRRFDYRLFWIGYGDEEPPRHLCEHLLAEGRQAFWVPGFDADRFLVQLAERLGAFPPDLVGKPFSHLQSSFDLIGSHELSDESGKKVDYLETARSWVEAAIERFEKQPDSPEKRAGELLTELRGRLISGDYEEAVRLASSVEEPSEDVIDLQAWALNDWGIALASEARLAHGDEANRLFDAAAEKYAQALQIKPDKHETINNWGIALSEKARRAEGDEARRLFDAAAGKYAQALRIKPDKHDALNNWGIALTEKAKRTEGDEARRLFDAAAGKYAQAVEIKPDKHDALHNWGNVLLEQVKRSEGQERARLLDAAEAKYFEALRLEPAETYNLACVRALQGRSEEARDLLLQAKEAGTLPSRQHLLTDEDLAGLRDEEWFRKLLGD